MTWHHNLLCPQQGARGDFTPFTLAIPDNTVHISHSHVAAEKAQSSLWDIWYNIARSGAALAEPFQKESSLRMAEMVSQLWPLRCSHATSRRRRVSGGEPRVRCAWRCAESTSSCFSSAAAQGHPFNPDLLGATQRCRRKDDPIGKPCVGCACVAQSPPRSASALPQHMSTC